MKTNLKKFDPSIFLALKMSYQPYKWPLIFTLIIGFLGRLLLLANANVIGAWVDSLIAGSRESQKYLLLLVACVSGGFAFTLLFRIVFSNISALAVSRLYDETTLRASRFPMSYFDQTPVGRVVTRFSSDYGNVFRLFGGPLAEFISIIFDLICMVILIGIASPLLLPWLVVYALGNYAVYRYHQGHLREVRRSMSANRSPSVAHFSETVQGSSTIRTFSKEESFISRFERLDSLYIQSRLTTVKAVFNFFVQMNSLTALLFLASGFFSIWLLGAGWVTVGAIGVTFGLITLSGNTILMFFEWLAQVEEALIGVERMSGFLNKDSEPGAKLPVTSQFKTSHPRRTEPVQKTKLPLNAEIEISQLEFSYGANLPKVLDSISFHVRPGERLGVVGRTGSGKSTITQCLLHLYPFLKGHIKVDGLKPHLDLSRPAHNDEIDLELFRRYFSYIPQEPILFRRSVRENLDFEGTHTDLELIKALSTVGLDFLATEKGLDLQIEEKAKNLSLGERQLFCMARALVQRAPILLMDEATSSVDPQSEEILVKATEEFFKDRTQILIAHRLSTLMNCDRILWLHQGRIQGLGSPEEIIPAFKETDLSDLNPMLRNSDELRSRSTLKSNSGTKPRDS